MHVEEICVHYQKIGLTCAAVCDDCRGLSCNKTSGEMEDENDERDVFEQFENFFF